MATVKPGTAMTLAREIVGPSLTEHGYAAARRSGPGVEWDKSRETGRFSFGIHAGPWDELTGGKLQVDFGGDVLDLVYSAFLQYLPESAHREWEALVKSIYDRALGHGDAVGDVDEDMIETRRLLLQQELDGLKAGYLDAFGWPWFDDQDLLSLYRFITAHFPAAEKAAMADADARQAEED